MVEQKFNRQFYAEWPHFGVRFTLRLVGLKVLKFCTKNVFLAISDSVPHKSPVADAFPGPQIKNFGWVGVFRPNGNYPRSCVKNVMV